MFKLEDKLLVGYFQQKSISVKDQGDVLKFKGPAKDKITPEGFSKEYINT
jgi:hypothetical protein